MRDTGGTGGVGRLRGPAFMVMHDEDQAPGGALGLSKVITTLLLWLHPPS